MKLLIGLIASIVLSSFTFAGAADKKAQSGTADYIKLGDIKGELHESDMNKKNQAVEDRYRKVGSGVLINAKRLNKEKLGCGLFFVNISSEYNNTIIKLIIR